MTPRRLDWRSVRPKLRTISELLDVLLEQYREYVHQVSRWFVQRGENDPGPDGGTTPGGT